MIRMEIGFLSRQLIPKSGSCIGLTGLLPDAFSGRFINVQTCRASDITSTFIRWMVLLAANHISEPADEQQELMPKKRR